MDETKQETPEKRKGVEDRSGLGLVGLTGGLVGGFVVAYYGLAPVLLTDASMNAQTLMTVATMVLMILGGGAGYYFTRRPASAKNGNAA
jgi:hypothetical protein